MRAARAVQFFAPPPWALHLPDAPCADFLQPSYTRDWR